jgi:hypothetical protein
VRLVVCADGTVRQEIEVAIQAVRAKRFNVLIFILIALSTHRTGLTADECAIAPCAFPAGRLRD